MSREIRRGVSWSAANVVASRTGQFLVGILVARLVAPQDFGVLAVALVVQAIVINVSELGVSAALVREPARTARLAPTVITLSWVNSAVLTVAMMAGAPALAAALGSPEASGAVATMAVTVLLAGATAVPSALVWRDFRQDLRFVADLASLLVSTAIVVPLALSGAGAMALAWSRVGGAAASAVVLLLLVSERYRPGFDPAVCRELLRFGLPLAGANIAVFATLNVDYVIVGRMLGTMMLGYYLLAFNIANWPTTIFGSVIKSVSFPAFSRVGDDPVALPAVFLRGLRIVALVTFPMCLMLSALSEPLVVAVYGERWTAAHTALVGLGVFAAARGVIELCNDLLLVQGRTRLMLVVQGGWLLALALGISVGVRQGGIAGAGAAHAVIALVLVLPALLVAVRGAGVRLRESGTALAGPALGAVACAVLAHQVAALLTNPWLACLAGGSAGLSLYLLLLGRPLLGLLAQLRSGGAEASPAPRPDVPVTEGQR